MKDLEEQRVCVKFSFKLGKTFTENFRTSLQQSGINLKGTGESRVTVLPEVYEG